MRILFITFGLNNKNGWDHYSLKTVQAIKKLGHEVKIIAPKKSEIDPEFLSCTSKISYCAIGTGNLPGWWTNRFLKFHKLIKWADIVHVTVEPLTVLTAFLTPKKKPLIFTGVGTYSIEPFRSKWAKGIFKRAWKRPARILAISDYTKQKIVQFHGERPINVIPLGVSLTEAMKNAKPAWTNSPQILGVGEVKRRKDFVNVIEALALLKEKIPGAKLVIAGSTSSKPEMERAKQAIEKHGLQESVDFRGFVSDDELKQLYQESQLFVMTSVSSEYHFEGFGLVYLEANGYGLPSIGSIESGASSAIKDNYSGKLVPTGKPEALSTAMHEILGKEESWKQYSRDARKFAEAMNWNTYAEKVEAVYLELLKKK